jgi:integrase
MWPGTGYVVVDELGNPPHPDTFGKRWRKALADSGVPAVRLHDARHSCATLMHLDGVPIAVIAAWLGHSDAGFTLSVYGHSQDTALAAAAERWGAITSRTAGDTGPATRSHHTGTGGRACTGSGTLRHLFRD